MDILLVTGKLAEPIVREVVSKTRSKHKVDIIVLPVHVISLLSTREIGLSLKRMNIDVSKYELVVVPGLCRGSCREFEEIIDVPCVKGSIHAYDLPLILELDDPLKELSREKPADEVIRERIIARNKEVLLEIEARGRGVRVGSTYIPYDPPPFRIMSEISNAYSLEREELRRKIEYFVENGVDIISLGFEPFNPRPDHVYRLVKWVKREYDLPIAIDTLIPSEIKAGVEAGVDLVLSIDLCNVDKVLDIIRDTPAVIIPYDSCREYLPRDHGERIDLLDRLYVKLRDKGFDKVIGDLILDPPITGNVLDSLYSYKLFKQKHPDTPLMMGVGNVSELFDVDSIGLNALLLLLGFEAGVSLFLTVENSVKTQGSTRELVIASQMISLAHHRGSPPKDLGVDLLVLKDKRRIETVFEESGAMVVDVKDYHIPYKPDPMGVFKIRVNHRDRVIEALYIGVNGKILIRGKDSGSIINYILDKRLVSSIQHIAYLGRELAKAEEALRINKNYVQEEPLFYTKEFLKIK